MVWEQLKEELIVTNLDAKTQDDVFEAVGSLMTQAGYTKDTYVEALKEREKDYPTGLDIGGFGVAIPHTAADYVNEAITGIATLKNPVDWVQLGSADDHVDVNIVFVLAVKDPNAHLDYLQTIVGILQNKEAMQEILKQDDPAKIIEIIKREETK